ncbi:hypothetical protein [Chamaesiphon sp.]
MATAIIDTVPTAGYANGSLSPEARLRQRLRIAYGRLTPTVQVAQYK